MGVGGRPKRERMYAYLSLIHAIIQQRLTQHHKAIILQLKNSKINLKNKLQLTHTVGFYTEIGRIFKLVHNILSERRKKKP